MDEVENGSEDGRCQRVPVGVDVEDGSWEFHFVSVRILFSANW